LRADPRGAAGAHLQEAALAAFVALAPRRDRAPEPLGLRRDALVEAELRLSLLGDHRLLPVFEARVAGFERAQAAALEPQHAGRDPRQERAVVADDQHAAGEVHDRALEPLDGRQVEVVGRLVEQQHVGLGDQRARQPDAPRLAARERVEAPRALEREAIEDRVEAVALVGAVEARADMLRDRGVLAELGLLRQVGDAQSRLREARALVDVDQAGERLQQGRLAAAVAPDQARALAARDADVEAGE
jgi:hypothetical protein